MCSQELHPPGFYLAYCALCRIHIAIECPEGLKKEVFANCSFCKKPGLKVVRELNDDELRDIEMAQWTCAECGCKTSHERAQWGKGIFLRECTECGTLHL